MPALDDPIEANLDLIRTELEQNIETDLTTATTAGILSLIPGIGSAIQSLLDNAAQKNISRRWYQLLSDLKERIEQVREQIPDANYYSSEEFQTLLSLAYQQLQTTHDRLKLKRLATGLANSGTSAFETDDKELLIRILRDLSPSDIDTLAEFQPRQTSLPHSNPPYTYRFTPTVQNPRPESQPAISRLIAVGLLIESLQVEDLPRHSTGSSRLDAEQRLSHALTPAPPQRVFQISHIGLKFIEFLGLNESSDLA